MSKIDSLNDATRSLLALVVVGAVVAGFFMRLTPSDVVAGLAGTAMGYWFGTQKTKGEVPPTPPAP